ncbi:hypothetical protein Tco_0958249 [Tanacetum coccineum]
MLKMLSVSCNEPELMLNQLELGATDAAGYVTNVGRTTQQKTGSTTLDFHLANQGFFLHIHSILIIDDKKIPMLWRLKTDDISGLELTKEVLPVPCQSLKPWRTCLCGQEIGNMIAVEYPILRYRLELEISDDTTEVVVVLFDETTRNTHTDSRLQDEDEHSGFPATLVNIVGTSQTLELKSYTEKLEDTDAEESFVADSQPKGDDVGCSSYTRKKRRVVSEDSE